MVSQRLPDGRRQVLDIVDAGRLLGLGSATQHDCSAEALTACVVRGYRRTGVETAPRTQARIMQAMALDARRMRQHLSINGRKFAVERVAAFLESLVDESDSTPIIVVPVSRGEMADYIGLTLETTSRCFAKLKRLKVLGKEHGDLMHVLDWPKLRQLARGVDAED
jgi:CRP-like cAMP-binding protein